MAAIVAPLFATTAHAALGVCDAAPPDNIEVEATAGTPGPTSYTTLGAAFAAINSGTHQGSIAIEVCGNTTEAASAVLNASGAGAALYTAISIKPVGGAARTVAGNLAAPLVDLNGADSVTIDGLNSGGNTLTLANASTAVTADTSTIRFIGGATGNTVTRTSVQGSSLVPLATAGGTIEFSTDAVAATGNDNNTISFCDIGPAGASLPIKAIFGLGTVTTLGNYNSGVVIDHNNIFDFFGTGAASVSGIHVLGGNDAWTISNNRLYQTAPRVFTANARYAGITLNGTTTGGAFTISGNTIGFGAANGTGTTTISGGANTFRGIDATTTNITTSTIYQNNVLSGINQTTSASGTQTSSPFIGFVLGTSDGRYNAIGNQIGSLDGSSTIVYNGSTTTATLLYGIFDFSFQSNTISNNSIGAFTIQGVGTTTGFRGIYWNTSLILTETVTGNTIGSAAGPIVDLQVGNNSVYGMNGVAAAANLSGNTVSYLSANSISATTPIVTVGGYLIGSTSTTVASTIARNSAHHLSNNAGVSANGGSIYGLSVTLPTTLANVVERNLLHTFTVSASNTAYQLAGIVASQGTTTYRNNMISLGLDASGNSITTGYTIIGLFDPVTATATTSQFYFNSVLISGAGVTAPGANSYALYSNVVTNTRNFQNNILWNARGNAVAGGVAHVAIRIGATTTGLASNYNDLLANGTDGAVGVFNATLYPTLANWQAATTQDPLSLTVDPLFVSTSNVHLQAGSPAIAAGTTIAGITDDFDGNPRPASNPDIGADQVIPGQLAIAPTSFDFGNQTVGSTSLATTITLSNTGGVSFNVTALTAAATPFALTGGTCGPIPFAIAVGANCTLTYTFTPSAPGAANQSFTVTASAPGASGFSLSGTGVAVVLAPTIAKSFTPASIAVGGDSHLAITLTNPNASAITLSANLVDSLPAGLAATAPATTCAGSASTTGSTITLGTGATIPASGSCTLDAHVTSAVAGSYVNTIAAGALQTSAGNNATAATATLTVTAPVTHVVTPSVGTPSGTITPSTPQTVNDGSTAVFTLAPAVGFHVNNVTGTCNGTLAANVFTTAAVTADCTVIANFAADTPVTHVVTPSVGTPSGTITPSTPQTVNDGSTAVFTLAPAVGFHVNNVTGTCNGTLAANVFTTAAVTADCTVIANFAANAGGTFPPDENFEEVTIPALPTGFTTAASGVGVAWVTQATVSDTAPNAAFSPDNANTGDASLTSPSVAVNAGAILTFRHRFNLESGFDGGHLEIAVDAGAFQEWTAAGGTFTAGGYNGTLTTFSGCAATPNPIGTGPAWSGNQATFITTTAALPAASAGHSVQLRWRSGSDCSVAATAPNGWWVDTIHLDVGVAPTIPAVAKSFTPTSVAVLTNSVATITLSNPTATAATLTANLVDTLPAGLVATAGTAATTCVGGAGASTTGATIVLATGAVIPATGSCTLSATVQAATAGSYVNTIAAGALQTSIGNNATAATATLTVTPATNPPAATVTPTSLTMTAAANATATATLNIANAVNSDPLTFAISAHATSSVPLRLHGVNQNAISRAQPTVARALFADSGMQVVHRDPAPWTPKGSLVFTLDDGTSEGSVGLGVNGPPATEAGAVWINRFTVTGAATVDSVSVFWPTNTGGTVVGRQANIVAYYDADGDGDPGNAVRLGSDNLVTIATLNAFETYTTSFAVPGAGDVYIGFVDQWAIAGGFTPRLFPAAEDRNSGSHHASYVSGAGTPPTDIDNLANNSLTGVIDDLSAALAGNWLIRATGSSGGTSCTGAVVTWLSAAPASGSVNGGANTDVTITATPAAGSLVPGTYTAELCVATNDPAQALISVPVTLTVTEPPFVPCSGGTDEIFCDGFEAPSGGGPGVYTDRTTFLTHVAAGFFENPFNDVTPSSAPEPARPYTDAGSGIAYTVDTLPTGDDLWNGTGVISTNGSGDQLTITFTGAPVTAVGGNFFASDVDVLPIVGNQVVLTLSDGTTETFTTAGDTDFRGFTTAAPITSITIDAPNPSDPTDGSWATLDNLIVGHSN